MTQTITFMVRHVALNDKKATNDTGFDFQGQFFVYDCFSTERALSPPSIDDEQLRAGLRGGSVRCIPVIGDVVTHALR